jgi:quinol monooxygenase YgiN
MTMIVLIAMLRAKQGKEKQVEGILKAMIPNVQNEKGATKYILHRAKDDPNQFLFYEEYTDQAALDVHNATSYFKELGKNLNGLLDGEAKGVFYEALASIKR